MTTIYAILIIAHRDFLKLFRDRGRLISSLVIPIIFIGILGGTFQQTLGSVTFDYMPFIFTGVFAMTIFQSAAIGLVSLIEDRENDFSQEMFVAPIPRPAIIGGKIVGEAMVALVQGVAIVVFGYIIGIEIGPGQLLALAVAGVMAALVGGAFGVIVLSNLSNQRSAQQMFPFIIMPQYFLAGIFVPVHVLPLPLEIMSRLSPMRYPVDLTRGLFYAGNDEYAAAVVDPAWMNGGIMVALFAVFLLVGTALFVRRERNR